MSKFFEPAKVIYADNPWKFRAYGKATGHGRSAESHYPTVRDELLMSMNVGQFAADDSVLLGWVVSPKLPDCIRVYESWGFQFVTVAFAWAKVRKGRKKEREAGALAHIPAMDEKSWHVGMGYYTRANMELCLLFKRGKPKRLSKSVRQLVAAPITEHSEKPPLYDRIEELFAGPYLELFARERHPGWLSWGNMVPGGTDLPELVLPPDPDEAVLSVIRAQKAAERLVRRSRIKEVRCSA